MTTRTRDEVLADVITAAPSLAWDDIGHVLEGLAFAQRPIRAATRKVTMRHKLGPRGAFILSLISGGVRYPLDLSVALKVGRSLVTAELDRLREAGLITSTPGEEDRRRSQLALTEEGAKACEEVRLAMRRMISRNLEGYSAEEIRLFGRMLRDARRLDDDEEEDGC